MEVEAADQRRFRRAPVMEAGSAVLLDINDGDRSVFAHLTPSAEVKIGKANCLLAPLIGCPFGAVFEVQFEGRKPQLHRLWQDEAGSEVGHIAGLSGRETGAQCFIVAVAEITNRNEEASQQVEESQDRDNRDLVDDNTAQTLSAEDIENMRREGASGKKIIDALIHNSASFQSKTQYSQEKYKRKKQKKYSPRIITRRPSARSVCDAYFAKYPQKIGFIRSDTLAILLSLANVGAHSDILVLDLVGGLLTAAVAERLGGYGSVCSTFCSPKAPSIDMVRLFNFDGSTAASVQRASLEILTTARGRAQASSGEALSEHPQQDATREPDLTCLPVTEGLFKKIGTGTNRNSSYVDTKVSSHVSCVPADQPCSAVNMKVGLQVTEDASLSVERTDVGICSQSRDGSDYLVGDKSLVDVPCLGDSRDMESAPDLQRLEPALSRELQDCSATSLKIAKRDMQGMSTDRRSDQRTLKAGRFAGQEDIAKWASKGFSGLIIGAPDMDPWCLVQHVFPLLSDSACFAIYHPYLQPLAQCMQSLQIQRMAVALQLSEPWCREYQVLPSRTHPHMQMSATGGYVLSGIKIVESEHSFPTTGG